MHILPQPVSPSRAPWEVTQATLCERLDTARAILAEPGTPTQISLAMVTALLQQVIRVLFITKVSAIWSSRRAVAPRPALLVRTREVRA